MDSVEAKLVKLLDAAKWAAAELSIALGYVRDAEHHITAKAGSTALANLNKAITEIEKVEL